MGVFPNIPPADESGIKAVIFDCDGVICPPYRFAALLREQHGITMDMTLDFFKTHFRPALIGVEDVAALLPPFLAEWGWKLSLQEFLDLWLESESYPRPEVMQLIEEVRSAGYLTALATNQENRRALYLRKEMRFEEYFDRFFISSEMGSMKPEDIYYREATIATGVSPEQIVFIDDQDSYLLPAAKHGWKTIRYDTFEQVRDQLIRTLLP